MSQYSNFPTSAIELAPHEEELVQTEVLRMWTTRMLLASRTSWLGYGTLLLLLWNTVPTLYLVSWAAAFVAIEAANIVFELRLLRTLEQPSQREPLQRILAFTLFPMGMLWGVVPLLPGVAQSGDLYTLSLLFLAVVSMISVHNLCFILPTLTTFTAGIAIPILVTGASSSLVFHQMVALSAMVLLVLLHFYGRKTHALYLHDMRSVVLAKKLTDDLAQRNQELKDALAQVQELARLDSLTQCLNRRAMTEALEREIQRNDRYGISFGVIMLDLDHFKSINDTYGHGAGDAVLIATASRLRARLRTSDSLARWGGEEFLCLVMHVDQATLLKKAQDLCDALAQTPMLKEPVALTVTGSFGIALCEVKRPLQEALDRADAALYRAKNSGRNRVCT